MSDIAASSCPICASWTGHTPAIVAKAHETARDTLLYALGYLRSDIDPPVVREVAEEIRQCPGPTASWPAAPCPTAPSPTSEDIAGIVERIEKEEASKYKGAFDQLMHVVYTKCCRIEAGSWLPAEMRTIDVNAEIAELRETMLRLARATGWAYRPGFSAYDEGD